MGLGYSEKLSNLVVVYDTLGTRMAHSRLNTHGGALSVRTAVMNYQTFENIP